MNQTFYGAWPALLTPSTAEGAIDLAALRTLVDYLLAKKVDGLYVCGSTGEGVLLSARERCSVAATVMEQVGERVPVIIHVGSISTRDSMALASHAQEIGATGVSSVLPLVQGDIKTTYRHYEAIAGAVPSLPFYPYLFGGQTDAVTLMQELLCRIPNVAGAKYTGPNMYEMGQIIALGDSQQTKEWTIFSGMDEQCLFAMMSGAPGNIGSTLNVMPGVYRQMRAWYAAGDVARALDLQKRANQVTTVLIAHGFAGSLREAIALIGVACGPPRLPQLALSADKREQLYADLAQAGFAELARM